MASLQIPLAVNNELFESSTGEILTVKSNIDFNVKAILYANRSESNRVNKLPYLTLINEIYGIIKETTSIVEPVLEIYYNKIPNFNYIYLENFDRYYYVSDISLIRNNLWSISLNIDVLMSYKEAIDELECFIDRNEYEYNKYLIDDNVVIEDGIITSSENILIDDDLFDIHLDSPDYNDEQCYVIVGRGLTVKAPTN